jgi:MFS family permease
MKVRISPLPNPTLSLKLSHYVQTFIEYFGDVDEVIRGLVVAIILLPSAFSGIFAGAIADKISRKYTIALGSAIFAVGSAISCACPPHLPVLFVARCIAGIGEGLFLGVSSTVFLLLNFEADLNRSFVDSYGLHCRDLATESKRDDDATLPSLYQ